MMCCHSERDRPDAGNAETTTVAWKMGKAKDSLYRYCSSKGCAITTPCRKMRNGVFNKLRTKMRGATPNRIAPFLLFVLCLHLLITNIDYMTSGAWMSLRREDTNNISQYFATHTPDDTNATKTRQVVILAGPHKTATTSTQHFLVDLSSRNLLGSWVWPKLPSGKLRGKQFARLAFQLRGQEFPPYAEKPNSNLTQHYTREFQRIWREEGRSNIVFGTEEMDRSILWTANGNDTFDRILKLMPWNTATNETGNVEPGTVTVVVNYRHKTDHLLSLWKQYAKRKRLFSPSSFREWLCLLECDSYTRFFDVGILNSLGQAEAYAERDQVSKVIVVDMEGVKMDGADISHVIACEALGLQCDDRGRVEDFPDSVVRNQGEDDIEVAQEELDYINFLLKRMDCSYQHLQSHPKLRFLHQSPVMFSNCTSLTPLSQREACKQIKASQCKTLDSQNATNDATYGSTRDA